MRQVKLGQSGLTVGAIAYGCWRLPNGGLSAATRNINTALDHGMTLIDTADIYGYGETGGIGEAERLLGQMFAGDPALRGRMVLTTKGGVRLPRPYDSSHAYLMEAVEASLKRLRVDTIDLYQVHRPDLTTSFAETSRALNDMVSSGKIRHIGVSNFTAAQTRALQAHLDQPILTVQPEFSALCQDPLTDGVFDWATETGALALAWSPLAGGALATGRSDHPRTEAIFAVLQSLAAEYETTPDNIALAFTMSLGATVIPIIGTQNPERIVKSRDAAQIKLSARHVYDIIEAYRGEGMP